MIETVKIALQASIIVEGRVDCKAMARAAIEAMKEPTEAMISSVRFDTNMDHVQTYRRMIEAALKE